MRIIDLDRGVPVSSPAAPLSIALGSFDGVHVGHRALITEAAGFKGGVPAVWTFDANPFGTPYLTELGEKLRLFRLYGAGYAVVSSFGEIRDLPPGEFVGMLRSIGAICAVCGFNFSFGKDRAGDASLLEELCAGNGMECRVVPPVKAGGAEVSSSRIRRALANGEVELANLMLGRNYSFTYPVVHGNEIARTLGYPTANQLVPAGRAPMRRGVYVTLCRGLPSVTNVGVRPTVCSESELVCETHVIGNAGDLYGSELTVEFLSFIRDERAFGSLGELKEQLGRDAERALGYFRVSDGNCHD